MKYYLVALFDEDSYKSIEGIQKNISKKYNLYKNLPTLHITLEVIEDPDIDKLDEILKSILKSYKQFKVEIDDVICFNEPYKSVNLKVENKGYIERLNRTINNKLKINGFNVRKSSSNWDLHISLANTNFASREWSKSEFLNACLRTQQDGFYKLAKIERIELWKPINNKRDMLIKSYPLKTFLP